MDNDLYSVDQVAERLGLHARTIRAYVRDGRLPATRIGKQYRIAGRDLEAFTGTPARPIRDDGERRAEVSSIVDIEKVDRDTAHRLTTLLMGAAATGQGRPLRIETAYDEQRERMKLVVLGGLGDAARLFDYIEGILES